MSSKDLGTGEQDRHGLFPCGDYSLDKQIIIQIVKRALWVRSRVLCVVYLRPLPRSGHKVWDGVSEEAPWEEDLRQKMIQHNDTKYQ